MVLNGIPKREYPKLFYRYVKELLEVIRGDSTLKLYLARNFPSFYKPEVKDGEKLKWKGETFQIPKIISNSCDDFLVTLALVQYSIPECKVEEGDIVFDVGAHVGFFSYHALSRGAREVHAFEPNPFCFEYLKKHAEIWDKERMKVYNLALSSYNGESDFFIPKNAKNSGWSRLYGSEESHLKVRVKVMTIDDFVKEKEIEKVDFIKIDTEGSEREILLGAKETIRKFRPKIVVSAYHKPDDKKVIPKIVKSIRDDYKFKLVDKGEGDLFFF